MTEGNHHVMIDKQSFIHIMSTGRSQVFDDTDSEREMCGSDKETMYSSLTQTAGQDVEATLSQLILQQVVP